MCRLYPLNGWRKWTDHLGNYLQIQNNKKTVSFEHSPVEPDKEIITDLYFKSHPQKIARISNWAFISFGQDDSQEEIYFIWFLGRDNRLRLTVMQNEKWLRNFPPLICGTDTLVPIIQNISVEDYRRADILSINGPIAAQIKKSWATKCPASLEFLQEVEKYNSNLKEICNRVIMY